MLDDKIAMHWNVKNKIEIFHAHISMHNI